MRDPIELEIFKNIFHSIAEEMGAALRRTAFSPNIKERRDYSCAVFDANGEVIAMGDHMPVHLGSMPMSVRAAIDQLALGPGDMAMLNDPFAGGTHLPDITVVAPVFIARQSSRRNAAAEHLGGAENVGKAGQLGGAGLSALHKTVGRKRGASAPEVKPDFYVASRAHHADVGGTYAGSMGICREIYAEGFRIPPVKIMNAGQLDRDVLALLLANVRTPEEREGDFGAQIAACHTGATRIREVCDRYTTQRVHQAARDLIDYSEQLMRAFLKQVPKGTYRAEDFLDNDGVTDNPVKIAVAVRFEQGSRGRGRPRYIATIDFTGSDPQVAGSINAVEAITVSACFYVFRCLLSEDVPATAGLLRPIRVIAPAGTVVNARPPAAVAGGNVETSQRIVDVLLKALAKALPDRIPAAASGTMNNLTIGGIDPRTGEPFAYYETIAGAMGARPTKSGISGVHTHMTNSLNTPIEALEYAYPFRVTEYSIRRGSGGEGSHRGGDGVVREVEMLTDSEVTLLADRRVYSPYGLNGGLDGEVARTAVIRDGVAEILPGKANVRLKKGDRIRVETPGGGGWGDPNS